MQAVMVGSESPGVGDRLGQRGIFISCCAQRAGAVLTRCELFGVPSEPVSTYLARSLRVCTIPCTSSVRAVARRGFPKVATAGVKSISSDEQKVNEG